MVFTREAVSPLSVALPRAELVRMMRLVRTLFSLSRDPAYCQQVLPLLPPAARINPGHDSVMMGYDFHLTPDGPKLIEVNTNAGGGLLAYLAYAPQTPLAELALPRRLRSELLHSFVDEIKAFSGGRHKRPLRIAILDERPAEQFLYPEMQAFVRLFEEWGVPALIVDPAELKAGREGVFHEGEAVELIYNRHTDFYLETPEMAGIREAYLNRSVCLTPNPYTYGLLADKRRMILWSDPQALAALGIDRKSAQLLAATIPESRLLADCDRDRLWARRQEWAFKPVTRFGSRGVLLGHKISRSRFDALPDRETLVQRLEPPSLSEADDGGAMKTDFRLYVYQRRVLGVAARLYRGQVTNLRTPGGGFAPVRLT